MRIFADPTELREGSTLPKDVAAVATPLPGLEEKTGADLLVSILDAPALSDTLLHRHCNYGALIQLKRLNDLQSSITDQRLFYDILKMREWSPFPWLVVSGVMLHNDGKVIVGKVGNVKQMDSKSLNMNVFGYAGLSYNAVDAALDAFAYYGGYIKQLPDDTLLLPWLKRQAEALQDIKDGKITELMPRSKWRDITGPSKVAWLASLFDGIGQKTAQAVYDKLAELTGNTAPTLYQAVAYVTDYSATCIPGITQERVAGWREFLGLHAGEETHLTPALYATLGIEWRLQETGEVYWHGPAMSHHYRNDGAIRPEGVNTPYYFRDLLHDGLFTLTYSADGQEQTVTGELINVLMERKFEYVLVKQNPDDETSVVSVRLDLITKVERVKGD
jgi:hypothetical protein